MITNPVNAGFSGGCNVGIRRALELDCDYVFLLNNDALVIDGTITELILASKRLNDWAILGSVIRFEKSKRLQFFGSQIIPRLGQPQWFEYDHDKRLLELPLIETDFVMGAALFASTKLLRIIGLFDERYFLTYEDVDLCYRARSRGARCAIVSSSTVYHHGSASMGPETAPLQTYFLTRNELLFTEQHCGGVQCFRMYVLRIGRLLRRMVKASLAGTFRDPSMQATVLGFRDYIFRRFGDCPDIVRGLTPKSLLGTGTFDKRNGTPI